MVQPASSINVLHQIGFEAGGPGTGGATSYRLQSMMIEPGDELAVNEFAPQGYRVDTIAAINQSWSTLAASGPALYTELLLAVENALGTVSPTTPAGAITARKRVYDLLATGAITPRTWTGQFGDSSDNVNAYSYGLLTDIGLKYDRKSGVTLDGVAGIAQLITTGSAFTAAPAALANVPILGSHVNYYLDTSGATLGTTQLTDEVLDYSWSVKGLKGPRWVSDRAQPSFKGHVDLKTTSGIKLALAEDAVTRAIVANLRNGSVYFLRANAQGQYVDNLQTVTITGAPTGGTFTLTYKSQTTAGIAYNAAAAAVQTALEALTSIGTGNVSVTGSAGGPYTVAFIGALAQDATLLTADGSLLTGGTSPSATVAANPFYYQMDVDIAFRLNKIAKYSDKDGVYMRELDGTIVYDPTWNHALMITSQTGIADL